MNERPANDSRKQRNSGSRIGTPLSVVAILMSIIAILVAFLLNSCSEGNSDAGPVAVTDCISVIGEQGVAGLSAYEVWLSVGNSGTEQEFLDSLVGEPGDSGYVGSDGLTVFRDGTTGETGETGASAYQLWLDAGNSGSEEDFLASLVGAAGSDGVDGIDGTNGTDGLSAFELWRLVYPEGTLDDFIVFLEGKVGPQGEAGADGQCSIGDIGPVGPQGIQGIPGAQGEQGLPGLTGPAGANGRNGVDGIDGQSGFGDSGSFWDTTTQGFDGLVSTATNTAYPMYFSDADTANNRGITIERCAGDQTKPALYPVTPKSCITFSSAGVYNIAFSAQLWRTQGGSESVVSIWLRKDGVNVPDSRTDVTVQSNSQKLVAAWNFFVPVECATDCDQYQLMWSYSNDYANIWFESATTNPARPAIPSVIMTVNQVK